MATVKNDRMENELYCPLDSVSTSLNRGGSYQESVVMIAGNRIPVAIAGIRLRQVFS